MNVQDVIPGMVTLAVIVCVMSLTTGRAEARVSGPTPGAAVHVGQLGPFSPATFPDRKTGVEYSVALFAAETAPIYRLFAGRRPRGRGCGRAATGPGATDACREGSFRATLAVCGALSRNPGPELRQGLMRGIKTGRRGPKRNADGGGWIDMLRAASENQ